MAYMTPFQKWMPKSVQDQLLNKGAGSLRGVDKGQPVTAPVPVPVTQTPPNTTGPTPADRLKFNAQYAGLYRNLDTQQAQLQSDRSTYLNRLTSDYDVTAQEGERNQALARRLLQSRMADQGILRSGINVGAQGTLGEDYLRYMDELSRTKAQATTDVESETARALNGLNMQREQLMFQHARDEDIQAREDAMAKAQAEAMQAALDRLQASQPKPTPTGQLTRQQPTDTNLVGVVENLFNQMGVPVAYQNGAQEAPSDRLNRIAYELESGQRSLADVVNSLRMQGGR